MSLSKGQHTQLRVLEVAANLFWRYSYHGVHISDIADAAGINKATLYQYYRSKEQLAEAVVRHNRQEALTHVFDSAFTASTQPLKRLEGIYRRVYKSQNRIMQETGEVCGCPFVNMGAELATTSECVRTAIEKTLCDFQLYYLKIVRGLRGQRAGTLKEVDSANALVKLMNGAMLQSKVERNPNVLLQTIPEAKCLALG